MAQVSDWYGTRAFERLALVSTQLRFVPGQDWDVRRKVLRAEMEPAFKELRFDPSSDEQIVKFDETFARRQSALRRMPYVDYLRTEHWQTVRACALARAGHACQVCADAQRLHVHHRSYDNRGNEAPGDVIVLCAGCHLLFHENRELAR